MKKKIVTIVIIATAVLLVAGGFIGLFVSGILEGLFGGSGEKVDIKVRHGRNEKEEAVETEYTSDRARPTTVYIESDESEVEELVKVGIINSDPNESGYRTANVNDMTSVFTAENGYDAVMFYSIKNDEKLSAANKLIEDGVDYLLVQTIENDGWEEVLETASEKGVKVIFYDCYPDVDEGLYEAVVVSDIEKQGETAVKWLEDQELEEYNIIHIQGILGSSAQTGRSLPLDNKAETESNWNIVVEETGEWSAEKAYDIVKAAIGSQTDFNVIYCENDDMAKGAVQALDEAGITHGAGGDVIIVSFDCNKWALEEVYNGNWNLDVQCSPFQAAYIDDVIKNGTNEKVVIPEEKAFDCDTITLNDVTTYGI